MNFDENEIEQYLNSFGDIKNIPITEICLELDRVWIGLGLNNKKSLKYQVDAIEEFYGHPVWILNGIYSEIDKNSINHRVEIAKYISKLQPSKVADYGGGSGVLARIITDFSDIKVDIIEPYPFNYFIKKIKHIKNINYIEKFNYKYDVVVAQDVLEHCEDPIQIIIQIISGTRMGGHLIFANCFYPDIKCHLPKTFYLRYTFIWLMNYAGLKFEENLLEAKHVLIFKRIKPLDVGLFRKAAFGAKVIGRLGLWIIAIKFSFLSKLNLLKIKIKK